VKGNNKTNLLKRLRATLNEIFKSYKNKKPELRYRIRAYGEISDQECLYLPERKILAHIQRNEPYLDEIELEKIYLNKTAEDYSIEVPNKKKSSTIKIFFSYSHKDETYKEELDTHFTALKRSQKIKTWNNCEILAGQTWSDEIERELSEANIILLLISADFIASDYISEVVIQKSLQMENIGKARVIPIFCRPCDLEGMPFTQLEGLPNNKKPISDFENKDKAYLEIVEGIKKVIDDLTV